MDLYSREQREGMPVACAYDCTVEDDGSVRAGLLFVRPGLPHPLTFVDPQTETTFRLALPADYRAVQEDSYGEREVLEAAP